MTIRSAPPHSETNVSAPFRAAGRFSRLSLKLLGALVAVSNIPFSISSAYAAKPIPAAPADPALSVYSYADVADLSTRAQSIAVVRARSFAKVPPASGASPSAPQRFYVEAQVDSLIRGDSASPPRIAFLLDVPVGVNPSRTLKGKPHILFGKVGPRPGDFQLLSSNALLVWDAATDARVRGIVKELLAPDAPPEIARVVEAFHVEGTVAGESETQIFLATRSGRPVSLSIIRRPDMQPKFGAALGEIVDEAADLPPKDTLLWYRLSCGLPPALPQSAAMKLDAPGAEAASADYRSFMGALSPCTRTRGPLGKAESGG